MVMNALIEKRLVIVVVFIEQEVNCMRMRNVCKTLIETQLQTTFRTTLLNLQ